MASDPEVLGQRYTLGSLLGRGGMGEVRAATDLRLSREVAIKVLRADLAEHEVLRGRIEREARAAARISHPNVVAIYDIGEDDGVPFIVMERLPGNSLADELATGPISEGRACSLAAEILSALDAAHQLGVIHRDIKPANVLLDPQSHAKVADFGIAKIAEEDQQTTMGLVIGTASYLAPERLAGNPATPASDLYAVGVLLYEALAGKSPFTGDTPLAVVESISRGVVEPLGELRHDVDPAIVAVVERAMRQDPKSRFASASEMATALVAATDQSRRAIADEPTVGIAIEADAAVNATRTMSTGELAAAQATVPIRTEPERARRSIGSSGPEPSKLRGGWIIAAVVVAVLLAATAFSAQGSNGHVPGLVKTPSSSAAPTGKSIPPPLSRAIDALDHAVQP